MDTKEKPPFLPPLILSQDMQSLTSLAGLQEITRTYREVMERNDREVDELFSARIVSHALERAQTWNPNPQLNEIDKDIFIDSPHPELFYHLKRIITFMSTLGIPIEVDSTLIATKIRDAIDALAKATKRDQ